MTAMTKKGGRLGPLLGRRCKHAAAELGPIHEARTVQTGAPALVMMLRRPPFKVLVAAGLAVLVLAGGLWLGTGGRPMGPPLPSPSTPGLAESANAGLSSTFLIDGEVQAPAGIAYPLPDKPSPNQVRPPCRTKADLSPSMAAAG